MKTTEVGAGLRPAPTAPPTARREIPLRGYIIVLAGTVIWALTGIVIKILLTRYGMETLTIAFWRVFIVTAFVFLALLIVDAKQLRLAPRDLGWFAAFGLIGVAVHQFVWITSVQHNGAAVATVIIYTSPALVAIFAWRFMREAMDRTKLTALALTLAGVVLVARAYDAAQIQLNPIGLAAGVGSAFTFATYSLIGRAVTRRYSAWTSLFYAFLFGTLFLLPVSLVVREFVPTHLPVDGWGTLFFLALVPTLGGFASYTIGLSHLPASVASILAAFEPVTTAIVAYLIFGEVLDALQLIGAAMILLGVVTLRPKS
ncbi:MAG: EamA family transporter [Chloroflexota bacterium]|nr:EamA family transporter [Chloroflexota bacterium]